MSTGQAKPTGPRHMGCYQSWVLDVYLIICLSCKKGFGFAFLFDVLKRDINIRISVWYLWCLFFTLRLNSTFAHKKILLSLLQLPESNIPACVRWHMLELKESHHWKTHPWLVSLDRSEIAFSAEPGGSTTHVLLFSSPFTINSWIWYF